ncbi:uncharacterized protein LOC101848656 [Aplysia californica]|uniref:Uncharacterized protein LOC101848656 n=1 Tax=Aplysia californica TaxID=6500 RepID=A0ABM0ZYX4_APLCA|nr:uncharacterized protein LOC101848656 [Aplysia californica]
MHNGYVHGSNGVCHNHKNSSHNTHGKDKSSTAARFTWRANDDVFHKKVNGTSEISDASYEEDSSNSGSDDGSGGSIGSINDVARACKKVQLERARSIPADIGVSREIRLFSFGSVHGSWFRRRKLILHLDIRNTILVADSVTDVTVEEALNSFLTGIVWGSEVKGEWKWHSNIPTLKSPTPGLVTYYKYLERKLVKNTADRAMLRLQTGDFTRTPLGKIFRKHFEIHLARLSWQHDWETSRDKVLTMDGRDGRPYHYILPSVYKLLHHLVATKRDFAIIIRTYGRDANNVLSSLHYGLRGHHPAFRSPLYIPVDKTPGTIKRSGNSFELKTFATKREQEIHQLLTHERDIYRLMCASKGISGYVDDFLAWQDNNYNHTSGKPIWIDPSDHRHHHIFFDDNFRADDEDSILDVRMFRKENPGKAESLSHAELVDLEEVCLVQADLLESIADEDYFIKTVQKCEENYARMVMGGEL